MIFNLKTQKIKLNKPRRQSLPSLVERSSAFLRCSLPPTLLPCVFGCSPSWRGLPPDHASLGDNGNAAIRPSSGATPQSHQFVCAAVRDAPLVTFQAPITKIQRCNSVFSAPGTPSAGDARTQNMQHPPQREASPTEPKDCGSDSATDSVATIFREATANWPSMAASAPRWRIH